MTATTITFENLGTFQGETEWAIKDGAGNWIGSITRVRPTKWHANGVSGLVADNSKPWIWTVDVNDAQISVPDGATLKQVKAAVLNAN